MVFLFGFANYISGYVGTLIIVMKNPTTPVQLLTVLAIIGAIFCIIVSPAVNYLLADVEKDEVEASKEPSSDNKIKK